MLPFKVFNETSIDGIQENKILAWLKNAFSQLKSMIFKLPFGKSTEVSISLRGLQEDFLSEEGGAHAVICGIYSEKWAVWSLMNEMKENNIKVTSSVAESKKEAERYGVRAKTAAEEKVSFNNKPLAANSVEFINKNLDGYKDKGIALGKRVFFEQITSIADSSYCSYEVTHSGGSDAKLSTADLKITKKSENDMEEVYRYSLKSYMDTGQVTKGTEKDPFGLLGLMIGKKSFTINTFEKNNNNVQADFTKAFGEDLTEISKHSKEISTWVKKRTSEIKKNKEVSPHGLPPSGQAKLEAAQEYGHEILDLQNQYYIRLFDLAMKKKPNAAKRAVLKLLDLEENSYSVLITAGQTKDGQITTWKSCSPELKKLMDTPIDKVDIKLESTVKKISKPKIAYGLGKATGKTKLAGSNLNAVFSIDGIEIYRVQSQLKQYGGVQFSTTCGKNTQRYHIEGGDLSEFLNEDDPKVKSLIDKEMKRPGSTKSKSKKTKPSRGRASAHLLPVGKAKIPSELQVKNNYPPAMKDKMQSIADFIKLKKIDASKMSPTLQKQIRTDVLTKGLSPSESFGRHGLIEKKKFSMGSLSEWIESGD